MKFYDVSMRKTYTEHEILMSTFQDRLWRKTRTNHPGNSCRGADANRNYPFHWNGNISSFMPHFKKLFLSLLLHANYSLIVGGGMK